MAFRPVGARSRVGCLLLLALELLNVVKESRAVCHDAFRHAQSVEY
jgi:hypothetical protein